MVKTKLPRQVRGLSKQAVYREVIDYIMIAVGMLCYSIGWTIFLLPNKIAIGGVAGLASIIYWGTDFPVMVTYFMVNAVLLSIALRVLGWRFCMKTIYGVVMLTVISGFFQAMFPHPDILKDQPFMTSIIAAVFCGFGQGIGLSYHGSSGGSEIVASMINKYHDISLGRILMVVDFIVVTLSYLVLANWEQVIYGYVVLIITSFVVDNVVSKERKSVQFLIISDKYKEISKCILETPPHRGCTVVSGYGSYTGKEMKLLIVVTRQREARLLYRLINDIDEHAFVTQTQVMGVFGQGFEKFKLKGKNLKKAVHATTPSTALYQEEALPLTCEKSAGAPVGPQDV